MATSLKDEPQGKDPKAEYPKWVTVHPSLVADTGGDTVSIATFQDHEHEVILGKREVKIKVNNKEEEKRAMEMHEYPKWVKLNPSRVQRVRDPAAADHVSVPEFSEFEVDRATKEVRVLVHDKDEERRAMEGGSAVKPAPEKDSRWHPSDDAQKAKAEPKHPLDPVLVQPLEPKK
jgi:hypothetical protein